ncbi:MAG: hypothetical protein IK008_05080 [Bacteroidales bacterium]|nr:hypothetical protein [Bacteroidales bacterium]
MGKRSTIIAVAVLALLLAGIIFAVLRLYHPGDGKSPAEVGPDSAWNILAAIPSDAAAVAVFDGSAKASAVLADPTGILEGIFAPGNPAFMRFLEALGHSRIAVSLHNAGQLVPLVAAQTQVSDSLLAPSAAKAGLKILREGGFVLASRSETFLNAGARALREGHSILDTQQMVALISRVEAPAALLFSHSQAQKLVQAYAGKAAQRYTSFLKNLTPWSVWKIQSLEKGQLLFVGESLPGEQAASFLSDFNETPAQRPEFPEVLPYYTAVAISEPIADVEKFFAARRKEEDGRGRLVQYNNALKESSGKQPNPEAWFTSLQPKEAVYASFRDGKGVLREAVLVRCGKDCKFGTGSPNKYRGFLATVLGPGFEVKDSVCASVGKWGVFGDEASVRLLTARQDYSLKDRLADASLEIPGGFVVYASFTDEPSIAARVFDKRLAVPLENLVKGTGFAPAVVSLDLSGSNPLFRIQLVTRDLKSNKVQVRERDTTVVVPSGPFPVTNSLTGKTNYLYQNSHKSICLRDENGKDLWGIPFSEFLCGRVQNIDYFQSQKYQFLFCAGSTLYALDRLGRWVKDFPVQLPKPVLLGPDVYDFTDAGGYTVMILHKDNTLERYNLHGEKVQGWKGIKAPETVKNLPELLEGSGKRYYWVVRTSVQTLIYPFDGGEPLFKAEGGRMMKPDASVSLTSIGVSGECYDGITHVFNLH